LPGLVKPTRPGAIAKGEKKKREVDDGDGDEDQCSCFDLDLNPADWFPSDNNPFYGTGTFDWREGQFGGIFGGGFGGGGVSSVSGFGAE